MNEPTKVCTCCGIEKGISEFYKAKRGYFGVAAQCKKCIIKKCMVRRSLNKEKRAKWQSAYQRANKPRLDEYQRVYAETNKVKISERKARYYLLNREEILIVSAIYAFTHKEEKEKVASIYRSEHKEEKKLYSREYGIKNRDSINKRIKIWLKTPKGKALIARADHNRRTRLKNTECTLTVKQWDKILKMQNNRCVNCGREFGEKLKPTKDHIIPLSLGGGFTLGNVQALCKSCNSKKRNRTDFMRAISELL